MGQTLKDESKSIVINMDENEKQKANTLGEETEPVETYHVYQDEGGVYILREEPTQSRVIDSTAKPDFIAYFFIFISLLAVLFPLSISVYLIFNPPITTVLIIPKEQTITTTSSVHLVEGTPRAGELQGRILPAITLSQSAVTKATGIKHQIATVAHGFITFYNGQFTPQIIQAGTVLTGADGIGIVTDREASIPAGNPPVYGEITVAAHAMRTGSLGNIQAYDINKVCCTASVLAKNTNGFSGGQDERTYTILTQKDIDAISTLLKTPLTESMHAALSVQLRQNETLLSLPCSQSVTPDHKIGEEATVVRVTIAETCTGITYNSQAFNQLTTSFLSKQIADRINTHYHLLGIIQATIIQTTVMNNSFTLTARLQGTWVYTFNQAEKKHLKTLIAGKTKQKAIQLLRTQPGVQLATLVDGMDSAHIPKDISFIHVQVLNPIS